MKTIFTLLTKNLLRGGLCGFLLANLFSPLVSAATDPAWTSEQIPNLTHLFNLCGILVDDINDIASLPLWKRMSSSQAMKSVT